MGEVVGDLGVGNMSGSSASQITGEPGENLGSDLGVLSHGRGPRLEGFDEVSSVAAGVVVVLNVELVDGIHAELDVSTNTQGW